MEIQVQEQSSSTAPIPGGITLAVSLDLDDMEQLVSQAKRALAIERAVPEGARTPLGNAGNDTYIAGFVETRATNDALETYGIVPVARPIIERRGLADGSPYSCYIHVHPRPHIGLTSLDPINLKTSRIPKPGFSARAAREEGADVEYLDDERSLRMNMVKRLDGELTEPAMRALQHEYTRAFERQLAKRNIDPETYRLAHGLNEEQYALMMARNALADAHWNYVLDAVFEGMGGSVSDEELLLYFEEQFPGFSNQLLELHELRNDLWIYLEKVRRAKALEWLLDNAIK